MRNGWGRDAHTGGFHARSQRGFLSTLRSSSCVWLRASARGKPVNPDFDVAVKRHQLLDAIQKASDTGVRQIL
jgi:hypothetical protein